MDLLKDLKPETVGFDADLHRDGDGQLRLYVSLPKELWPDIQQGADELTPCKVTITRLIKQR